VSDIAVQDHVEPCTPADRVYNVFIVELPASVVYHVTNVVELAHLQPVELIMMMKWRYDSCGSNADFM